MELQVCLLFTTLQLVNCGGEIRPAGWLDKVVAHWKRSFIDDFEQLGPFNLDATIEKAPPGYKDSPEWDFDSVSRMLALLSVSETGQPALNSLRRMIAPTRRMMADVPGLSGSYIPQSLYNNRKNYYRSGNDKRGMRNRKRTGNNRMRTINRKDMAGNQIRMTKKRKDMAGNQGRAVNWMGTAGGNPPYPVALTPSGRKGIQENIKSRKQMMAGKQSGASINWLGTAGWIMGIQGNSRKQMLEKRIKEKQLSDFQMSFRLFPSMKEQVPNNIYYDGERTSYEDDTEEYEFVDPSAVDSEDNAIVLLRNPVEARLPSSRISVKLLKEILEARAVAARVMPPKKTTRFSWMPMDVTTPLSNGTSDVNSTATTVDSVATGGADNAATTVGGGDAAATTLGGGGGDATTTVAGDAAEPAPERRKDGV